MVTALTIYSNHVVSDIAVTISLADGRLCSNEHEESLMQKSPDNTASID